MNSSFHIFTKVHIRFADCDMFGHVNNAKFITYMEEARVEYFKAFPEINFLEKEGDPEASIILAEIACAFKSPARLDETLIVKIRTSELRRSSFVMDYEIIEEKTNRLVATGRSAQVMYNYREKKTIAIPESIRKRFEEVVLSCLISLSCSMHKTNDINVFFLNLINEAIMSHKKFSNMRIIKFGNYMSTLCKNT